jgi:hypothetical protein
MFDFYYQLFSIQVYNKFNREGGRGENREVAGLA